LKKIHPDGKLLKILTDCPFPSERGCQAHEGVKSRHGEWETRSYCGQKAGQPESNGPGIGTADDGFNTRIDCHR
jgi:hypothetical protein